MSKPNFKRNNNVKKQPKEFEEEVIQIDRVTRVVKGGRKLRFRATVVIGNKKGRVGVGTGKSNEVAGAIQKALTKAKRNASDVILNGATIPHDIKLKYKSAKLALFPASEGTGIIAGGPVRKVLELAGVTDILSKCYGTTNKISNTRVAFEALKQLRSTPYMDRKKNAQKVKVTQAVPAAAAKAEAKPVKATESNNKPEIKTITK